MSLQDIKIIRRQPIINKKYVKVPNSEDTKPYLTVDETLIGINTPTDGDDGRINLLNFGFGERVGILPNYQMNSNLDFVTYDQIGVNGKNSSNIIDDIQLDLNKLANSKY